MARTTSGLSPVHQRDVWVLLREGQSLREIGRNLGLGRGRVERFMYDCGGIRPAERRRRAGHLTAAERETVSRGLASGDSARSIAQRLGRSPSTISREIARNGGAGSYRAVDADAAAVVRARRPKPSVLEQRYQLRAVVLAKLREQWSPEQISRWLRLNHPDDPMMKISHESIYRSIFVRSREVFDHNISRELRTGRPIRRPRGKKRSHGRGRIRNMVSIDQRSAAANDRTETGHLEGDLVFGARPSAVATLVDRRTRVTHLVALPDDYKAETVAHALTSYLLRLPPHQRRSLTWDRGREMAAHQDISTRTGMPIYFCAPHHPWQRGTNENTNGLLRQYLSKTADLRAFTQTDLDTVADRLNHRPRRILAWHSPFDVGKTPADSDAEVVRTHGSSLL